MATISKLSADKDQHQPIIDELMKAIAINIFKEFYDNAFIQTGKYVPPSASKRGSVLGHREG